MSSQMSRYHVTSIALVSELTCRPPGSLHERADHAGSCSKALTAPQPECPSPVVWFAAQFCGDLFLPSVPSVLLPAPGTRLSRRSLPPRAAYYRNFSKNAGERAGSPERGAVLRSSVLSACLLNDLWKNLYTILGTF